MRVLVTGSSGQVGGAVVERLTGSGEHVVGLSRGLGRRARLATEALAIDIGTRDLADTISARCGRCEAIVHAAASLDRGLGAAAISLTNCLGTQQLLELARRWRVDSFVYLSSIPVIGRPRELPITELHPADPPTAYHASKLYGEQLVALAQREGMPAVTLRLSAPVGPGTPKDRVISVFVRQAVLGQPLEIAGRGTRGQDYVDVRDIAAAVQSAVARPHGELLNVASGVCTTNVELGTRCIEVLGSSSRWSFSGAPDPDEGVRWEVSTDKAKTVLGYEPQHSLDDSIRAIAQELERESAHA